MDIFVGKIDYHQFSKLLSFIESNNNPTYFDWINLIITTLAFGVVALYTIFTYKQLKTSRESVEIQLQPFLNFYIMTKDGKYPDQKDPNWSDHLAVRNSGNGTALNIFSIYMRNKNECLISKKDRLISTLEKNKIFPFDFDWLEPINNEELKSKVDYCWKILEKYQKNHTRFICLIYQDFFNNKYITIITTGSKEFGEMTFYKKLGKIKE